MYCDLFFLNSNKTSSKAALCASSNILSLSVSDNPSLSGVPDIVESSSYLFASFVHGPIVRSIVPSL